MRIYIASFFLSFFTGNFIAQSNKILFDYDQEKEKLAVVVQSRKFRFGYKFLKSVKVFNSGHIQSNDYKIDTIRRI